MSELNEDFDNQNVEKFNVFILMENPTKQMIDLDGSNFSGIVKEKHFLYGI